MHPSTLIATLALASLPLAASAEAAPVVPASSDCTLTMNFLPAVPPASPGSEPVIVVDNTQTYHIKTFSVATARKPHAASFATVTADMDLEPTVATLLDQHAVIERALLACPTRSATVTNATIGYIGTSDVAGSGQPSVSFTMNFWTDNLAAE